jgi:hypothetical protein
LPIEEAVINNNDFLLMAETDHGSLQSLGLHLLQRESLILILQRNEAGARDGTEELLTN